MNSSRLAILLMVVMPASRGGELVLTAPGIAPAPIIVATDATPSTRRAAAELANVIEKISGQKPAVMDGPPTPIPERAVWVGLQPQVKTLFPEVDFEFTHPEEILIAANDHHVVIAGRDRWDPEHPMLDGKRFKVDHQFEYGTCNAVYTFLQDQLGVRWLWPGEEGTDIVRQPRIALKPFTFRYHPRITCRKYVMWWNSRPDKAIRANVEWSRLQRLNQDASNLYESPDGHAFGSWWDRFGKTNPELFALQPNGTRGPMSASYSASERVKLCDSNPAVWDQWLRDVEQQLEENPIRTLFRAAVNDGNVAGLCVCERCKAWDAPQAEKRRLIWDGLSADHVALTDRHVRLANTLARKLAERYPGRDYKVMMLAYGPSTPAPIAIKPDANVIVVFCTNWFEDMGFVAEGSQSRKPWSQEYAEWAATGAHLWVRPNLPGLVGQYQGLPDVALTRVAEYVRYVADRGATGMTLAHLGNFWRTQGPLYYLLAQLAWNPDQDAAAVLDDYFQRAFGPAKLQLQAYWSLLEQARNRVADDRLAAASHVRDKKVLYENTDGVLATFYDAAFFTKAAGLLDEADRAVASSPDAEKYRTRIATVRTGLDYTRKLIDIRVLMAQYRSGRAMSLPNQFDTEAAAPPKQPEVTNKHEKPRPADRRPSDKEQIAARVRELWDQIEVMIKSDPLLAGRSPYTWNRDLYPDKVYPYQPGLTPGIRVPEPKK